MQNAGLGEAQARIKIAGGNIKMSDTQMIPLNSRKWRETKEPLDEGEREKWKSCLKIQHSEN